MFANLSDIIKIPLAVLAGILISVLFYEGIRLPWVGQIVPGIVWYRVDAAKSGMVDKAKLDAANVLLRKARDDAAFNERMAKAAQQQADQIQSDLDIAQDKLNAAISKDSGDDGGRWGPSDTEWMRNR